ncbi:flagellar hook capping FlgD N-terminal domain-containing protein [Erwinia sp. V90_4]|jgi:flagellar basal-body rod modification protein FlgD|uniref:flagellar hook assembly protein FlgD n=1 Tax=Erwinia TaxID=551 RepID=UPI00249E6D46|nr:flagellar hook capping FlgD N-terminal domain-containing protein [Erwinia sp. V90_4]MDI3439580.1 flagellar hook capping FlgD N-terminal domain-containing protein [Erwinia sp. V90_4]
MAVSSVNNNSNNGVGTGSSAADLTNSFMTLLVAQMQNQDPTNPMDNNQLTSQLAQFNTAAGVESLNKSLNTVGGLLVNMQQMSSASWVGREVMVEGDQKVTWGGVDTARDEKPLSFALGGEAEKVTVTLTDAAGKAYTAELKGSKTKAGINEFSLDDLENFKPSEPEADMEYTVTYSASAAEGQAPEIVGLVAEKIEAVSFGAQGAVLHLAKGKTTTLSEIFVIR